MLMHFTFTQIIYLVKWMKNEFSKIQNRAQRNDYIYLSKSFDLNCYPKSWTAALREKSINCSNKSRLQCKLQIQWHIMKQYENFSKLINRSIAFTHILIKPPNNSRICVIFSHTKTIKKWTEKRWNIKCNFSNENTY